MHTMEEDEVSDRGENGSEGEREGDEIALTKKMAGECLSILAKTGSGMAHAYIRMDLRDKWVNS